MVITGFYGALLAGIFLFLSTRVIRLRRGRRIRIGDADDPDLRRRIRVHGNFAEYAPFGLLLLGLAESLGPPPALLHLIGTSLVAGRAVHAYGFGREPDYLPARVAGMILTLLSILAAACLCLFYFVTGVFE